jgi:hypothetical protein
MRSVRIPIVRYDASKGHLSPIDASGCANVIEESVVFLGDSGGDKSRGFDDGGSKRSFRIRGWRKRATFGGR